MHLRDKEVSKLLAYAKGLGIKVKFKPYRTGCPGGEYCNEERTINVYKWPKQTKTDVILILLHELGHHIDWVYKNKRDPKVLLEALYKEESRTPKDPPISKRLRKRIYQCEYDGTAYMPIIAKELDLKIPMWKVEAEMECDRWVYKQYFITGDIPTTKEVAAKRKELRKQFRSRI